MLAALSVALLFLSNFISVASLALSAIAGVLLIPAVIEASAGWAFMIYGVVSILSLLLLGDKSSALFYIFLFGHYPIVKNAIERKLQNKPLQWVIKLLFQNVCAFIAMLITYKVTGVGDDSLFKNGLLVTAILFNVTFVLYDIALSRLIVTYVYRIRKIFHH